MVDINLLYGQTFVSTITFLISLYASLKILGKDRKFFLNRVLSLAILLVGTGALFLALSNLPVILYNESGSVEILKISYSLVVISLSLFLLSALFLKSGRDIFYSKYLWIFLFVFIALDFFVLWLTESIINQDLGDVITSDFFKIFVLGYLVLCYLLTLFYFYQTFRESGPETKGRMKILFIGWIFGGIALFSIGVGDFFRLFDLIGPIFLSIGTLLINYSFKK
ncbi:MAG: hypothetical protein ACW967_00720 [Candidatus Hodarchaeales archaeon]|jgi:hypothetical protein